MAAQVHVAFLWHMHQPWYLEPGSHHALLPWTRLRATKDYTDMALLLEQTQAPVTVNFAPSLVEQLRRYASGQTWDAFTPSRATPQALEEIRTGRLSLPLARRGFPLPNLEALRSQASTPQGERNLWGWFLLSWTAQAVLEARSDLHLPPGHAFTAPELAELEVLHGKILAEVVPRYRKLAEEGVVELSATPFYHPILPLLLDSAVARRPHPEDTVPAFSAPEDAHVQVAQALAHHKAVFGKEPQGMWPAEGAVSPEAAAVFAQHGVLWIATDGEILARTLGRSPAPEELHLPWKLSTSHGEITVLFRDTFLSNRISFDYHAWRPADAVADFVERLKAVGAHWKAAQPPLVLIAMDGENAWDFYERNGRAFLLDLYHRVQDAPGLCLTRISDYLAQFGAQASLPGLWSGSWISADFRTWIGYPKQNQAWERLAAARAAVASHPDPERRARAREHIYIAQGSDWFWWLSPYNTTPQAPLFDRLFRAHLAQTYRELGQNVPALLQEPLA